MNKDDMQLYIEKTAYNAAQCVRVITEDVLFRREAAKQKSIENAKRYAYEQAYENKYGSLQYIKHF